MAAALTGACPRCAARTLFDGWVGFAGKCRGCGLDFQSFNVGDRWNGNYRQWSFNQVPLDWRNQYGLDRNNRYYYRDGYLYASPTGKVVRMKDDGAAGNDYGYPDVFGDPPSSSDTEGPVTLFQARSVPTGVICYDASTALNFPARYDGALFVSLFGSDHPYNPLPMEVEKISKHVAKAAKLKEDDLKKVFSSNLVISAARDDETMWTLGTRRR